MPSGVLDFMQSPLFMAGAGLMTGGAGGMASGAQAGASMQAQLRKRQQEDAMRAAIMKGGVLSQFSPDERAMLAESPELASGVLGTVMGNKVNPMLPLQMQNMQGEIDARKAGLAMDPLKMDLLRAQIESERAKAANGGGEVPASVREWEYYSGLPTDQQDKYLGMKRASENRLVGNTIRDMRTGVPVADVGEAIAGGEAAKVEGKATAEGKMNLPKAEIALKQYEIQNGVVKEDIGRALNGVKWGTTGWRGVVGNYLPGSDAYNLKELIMGIKANVGFDHLQQMRDNSPTGGALGQVSEQENRLLQSVLGSLENSQSEDQLRFNLQRLDKIMGDYQDLRQRAYKMDVERFGGAPAPSRPDPLGLMGP